MSEKESAEEIQGRTEKMTDEPKQTPISRSGERSFRLITKPKNVRMYWGCRHESHTEILLFADKLQATMHHNETGHAFWDGFTGDIVYYTVPIVEDDKPKGGIV